jgi:hypothetical protein
MAKKCPLCKETPQDLEKHIQHHIKTSYQEEVQVFHRTQEAVAVYKKLFKTEP